MLAKSGAWRLPSILYVLSFPLSKTQSTGQSEAKTPFLNYNPSYSGAFYSLHLYIQPHWGKPHETGILGKSDWDHNFNEILKSALTILYLIYIQSLPDLSVKPWIFQVALQSALLFRLNKYTIPVSRTCSRGWGTGGFVGTWYDLYFSRNDDAVLTTLTAYVLSQEIDKWCQAVLPKRSVQCQMWSDITNCDWRSSVTSNWYTCTTLSLQIVLVFPEDTKPFWFLLTKKILLKFLLCSFILL